MRTKKSSAAGHQSSHTFPPFRILGHRFESRKHYFDGEHAGFCASLRAAPELADTLESPLMAGAMNWLDYALLVIIGLSVVHGLSNGALRMLTSLLSFGLGIYGASVWHHQAGALAQAHLGTSPLTSEIIGYAAIFVLIFVAVESVGQRLIALVAATRLNLLDRLAGAGLGAVLGAILAGLNIMLLTALLPSNYPLLLNSQLAPKILSYDRELIEYIPPQVKQIYQDKRDQLSRYWNAKNASPANAFSKGANGAGTN